MLRRNETRTASCTWGLSRFTIAKTVCSALCPINNASEINDWIQMLPAVMQYHVGLYLISVAQESGLPTFRDLAKNVILRVGLQPWRDFGLNKFPTLFPFNCKSRVRQSQLTISSLNLTRWYCHLQGYKLSDKRFALRPDNAASRTLGVCRFKTTDAFRLSTWTTEVE
jgi:hypothetical protein